MTNAVYSRYLKRLSSNAQLESNSVHVLDDQESNVIRRIYRKTIVKASIIGALGVILYFLPIQFFPKIFPYFDLVDFYDFNFRLEYGQILFGMGLMVLELHILVLINLQSVHQLANVMGFYSNPKTNNHQFLLNLGLEVKDLRLDQYGIDPFQGINRNLLVAFNLLLKLKGFLANKLLQYLVKRLLGRYAIRYVVDYIGIPIYMGLNAYGAYVVMNRAKVCLMGVSWVHHLIPKIPQQILNPQEKDLIYDSLQLIAMSKRDYHTNHVVLTQALFEKFDIAPQPKRIFTPSYYQQLAKASKDVQYLCEQIIIMGFILDGKISFREYKKIRILNACGVLNTPLDVIKDMSVRFWKGQSVPLFKSV